MRIVSVLLWLFWSLPGAHAEAPPAVLAEQARLQSEMQKLAQRETWEGVEGLYQQLIALEPDGAELTYAEHILGAEAARAMGNVVATRARLLIAISQWETKLATDWLADIDATYGRISIQLHPRYKGERTLSIDQLPFEADRRFAITFAQETLADEGRFDGYLPQGRYTLGGESFSVAPGPPVTLNLLPDARTASADPPPSTPPPEKPPREPRAPREPGEASGVALQGHLRLGAGYGGVGAPTVGGIEPVGFQGFSPQAGLGVGVLLGQRLRLRAEGGLWGASQDAASVRLGYGSLLAGARLGPLWLEAGPLYARGGGQLVGVDPAALQVYCAQDSVRCDYRSTDTPAAARVSGTVAAGGVSAGAAIPVAQTGAVGWLVGVDGGAVTDQVRWLSWARLALTVQIGGGSGS